MNINKLIIKILSISIIILTLKSCGIYRKTDAREFPPEPEKRVQKNLEEGRGFRIFDDKNKGGGTFEFASSNEMWRASLDIIDFMPLISADYGGGLIITDWYGDENQKNESVKISIRFLTNEIRSDALEITVFTKQCNTPTNCKIQKSDTKIENELKIAILKQAAKYKKDIVENTPKRQKRTLSSINPGG
jgi:hypothetical protein